MPFSLNVACQWMCAALGAGVLALGPPALASDSGVHVEQQPGAIEVTVEGRPAFTYARAPRLEGGHGAEFARGAFLHPVRTPRGVLVTDAFSYDHPHQTGLFAAWTATRFAGREIDFWNLGKKLGRVEPVAVERVWSGADAGGFVARHRYVDLTGPEPRPVLDEWWQVTVARSGVDEPLVIDLQLRQACAGDEPLELLEYRYGGFTFRGHAAWLESRQVDILSSEGERDRVAVNGTRVRWCAMSGAVGGAVAGVALMSHLDNFRAPEPVRVHPSMPMLGFAPPQLGAFAIQPGEPRTWRYRVVVFDGSPDAPRLELLWQTFAGAAPSP